MIIVRALFVVILAVKGLVCDQQWKAPITFNYQYKNTLSIDIILQNVPLKATNYILYYQTGHCDKGIAAKFTKPGSRCNVSSTRNNIPKYKSMFVKRVLDKENIIINLELLDNSKKTCSTKLIIDGVRDSMTDNVEIRKSCLNYCRIYVDFHNKCDEHFARNNCLRSREDLECYVLPNDEMLDDTSVQWFQTNREGSSMRSSPTARGKKTAHKMKFHKFDNNTFIRSKMSTKDWVADLYSEPYKISLPTNEKYFEPVLKTKFYSERWYFKCDPIYEHAWVGYILNPTEETRSIYFPATVPWTLSYFNNNSIVCCIYYKTYLRGDTTVLERVVKDYTKLIYAEPVKPPVKAPSIITTTMSSAPMTDASQPAETTSTPTPLAIITDAMPTIATPSPTASLKPSPKTTTNDSIQYYIIIASATITLILISLVYVIIKILFFRNSPQPERTLELETYAAPGNTVLYAELDIRPGNAQPPPDTNNSTYAEIIGVLGPRS